MDIRSLTTVFPVANISAGVSQWREILGADPAFVDGERWAQFTIGANRIALAGPGQGNGKPGLMIKVGDLEAARERLREAGLSPGAVQTGPHERYFEVTASEGCAATFYAPL